MEKVKIKVISLGVLPPDFNTIKINTYKSKLFEIVGKIESYTLSQKADGYSWEYSDQNIIQEIPNNFNCDFLLVVTNVPLENNYYSRRVKDNVAVITFHEMKDILRDKNIPLENLILRVLYAYSLAFLMFANNLPLNICTSTLTHDESRGCLFDMTGIKNEIIYSCQNPKLCTECLQRLRQNRISSEKISIVEKELQRIKKPLYFRVKDIFQRRPIISFTILVVLSTIINQLTIFFFRAVINWIYALPILSNFKV